MADFKTAYDKTARNEGGYSNDPADTGGETWKGIARKKNPDWKGWEIVDSYRANVKFPGILHTLVSLELMEREFYRTYYWSVIRGDEITDQAKANSIYDSAVNMGPKAAVKLAQRALEATETGVMDNATLKLLNA